MSPTLSPATSSFPAVSEVAATRAVRCRRCAFAPRPGQLRIFDLEDAGIESSRTYNGAAILDQDELDLWPAIETSHCGRIGFWRERSPAVFGHRIGIGPLAVMPDTNILISIRAELDEVEGALILHPLWSARDEPVDALRDLVQLWWWRDLRFVVSPLHLADTSKPLTEDRRRAREDAVRELGQDFFERGGLRSVIGEEIPVADEPCALHSIPPARPTSNSDTAGQWRWPDGERDRELVGAAYDSGCHVFLTADKGILKCHPWLYPKGLAVMSPSQLLEALDNSGELDGTRGGNFLLPDLSALSRLYAGFHSTEESCGSQDCASPTIAAKVIAGATNGATCPTDSSRFQPISISRKPL